MKPFKSIIVDDEIHAIELLSALLGNIPSVELVNNFTSPVKAIKYLSNNKIDLIFLDVQMPELSGIEFVKTISEMNIDSYVVFVTAHDQYMLEALRVHALDFLLKPVDLQELKEAIARVRNTSKRDHFKDLKKVLDNQQRRKLRFNTRNGFVAFFEDEILYIKADGVYSLIHLANGKEVIISQNLGKIEEQLGLPELIKIHRSVIVNANYIFEINRSKKECNLSIDSDSYKLKMSSEGLKTIEKFLY